MMVHYLYCLQLDNLYLNIRAYVNIRCSGFPINNTSYDYLTKPCGRSALFSKLLREPGGPDTVEV